MVFMPMFMPITSEAATNTSQPKTAVFQWLALQRPMRAAMLFERFKGDIAWAPSKWGWPQTRSGGARPTQGRPAFRGAGFRTRDARAEARRRRAPRPSGMTPKEPGLLP